MNYTRPQLAILLKSIKKAFVDANKRGVRLRYLTEITPDNISYCKDLMTIVHELRHLGGIRGNFTISESEYLAPVVLFEKEKIASQIIYSNIKELVEQQQYVFDILWSKAIPARQRIREIEEGIPPIRTKIVNSQDEIIKEIKHVNNNADKLSICTGFGGMQMSYNYFFDSYKKIIDKHQKQEGDGLRFITNIDKESLNLVKIFLDSGMQIRHIKNMPPMSFGVSDKEVAITIEKMEGGKISQSFLISNEPLYVNHFDSIFEELWKNGIDAIERTRDIDAGLDLSDIEAIPSSERAQDLYLDIVKSAAEEILWIFPTTNAFIRQEKIGAVPLGIQAAKERNVKVRILVPANNLIEQKVQQLKQYFSDQRETKIIDVRYIEQMSETKATILVVDRKFSLVMELRDDSKTTFLEAIGNSTYSNSKSGVLSYVAIFENLWRQTELYQELMKAHEQLKDHSKMQRDFINIAAHEMRTPIQPVLGLAEILSSKIKDPEQLELLDVIIRNAKRSQKLTNEILDVTKIENQSLELKKQLFNLNDVIINTINDVMANRRYFKKSDEKNQVKLSYEPQDVVVAADKARITEVISNLLINAVKFTKEGTISISIVKKGKDNNNNNNNKQEEVEEVTISVKDEGVGIDPQILPRLFTKFATKSETEGGTGLGLYISKSIVEAHGGRIWAANNKDGKGATFTFSLPIIYTQVD